MRIAVKRMLPAMMLLAAGCGSGTAMPPSGTGPWLPLKVGYRWTYQVTEADGSMRSKVQGVTSEGAVGVGPYKDTIAFRLVTGNRFNDDTGDVSFQAVVSNRVVRYSEKSIGASSGALKNETYWEPPKLRIDDTPEHTALGASWPESYTEHKLDTPDIDAGAAVDADPLDAGGGADAQIVDTTKQVTDIWEVMAVNDPVKVPAGDFKALKLQRISQDLVSAPTIKYFWFVRGVGKIKEAGEAGSPEQLEELISYTVTP